MVDPDVVDYTCLLAPDCGSPSPSVKTLRDHEGLFERFEVVGSNAALYFPSSVVLDSMGNTTLHDDGVFYAYVLIEGFKDIDDKKRIYDAFASSNSGERPSFSVVRRNKSNKGISKVNRSNINIIERVANRTQALRTMKRRHNIETDVFWVTLEDPPYKICEAKKDVSVFYNEKAGIYGFSGMAICGLHFADMRSPS